MRYILVFLLFAIKVSIIYCQPIRPLPRIKAEALKQLKDKYDSLGLIIPGSVVFQQPSQSQQQILNYIRRIPLLPYINPNLNISAGAKISYSGDVGKVPYKGTETKYTAKRGFQDFAIFTKGESAIYPGAGIQCKTLDDNMALSIIPSALKRTGGTLTFTTNFINSSNVSKSIHVNSVNLAAITDARTKLFNLINPHGSTGGVTWEMVKAKNIEHALIQFGIHAKVGGFTANATGAFDNSYETNTVFIRFTQIYYTIVFEPDDIYFFDKNVKLVDFTNFAKVGNPPGYVSTVRFGRTLLISIKSRHSFDSMKLAIDAAYDKGFHIDGNISAEKKQILESSEISISEIGGPSGVTMKVIKKLGVGTINDIGIALEPYLDFSDVSKDNPGSPIFFDVTYMADNVKASSAFITEYVDLDSYSAPDEEKFINVCDGPVKGKLVQTNYWINPSDIVTIVPDGSKIKTGIFAEGGHGTEGWSKDNKPSADFPYPNDTNDICTYGLISRIGAYNWVCVGRSLTDLILRIRDIHGDDLQPNGFLQFSENDNNLKNGDDSCWGIHFYIKRANAQQVGKIGVGATFNDPKRSF
ncbi:MAG: thiol-activated cytolysin family protein [Saprospiraceae bacterium]|nr:thiol-activated cytolysin family protein [Saprospiraceae bacterium]